MRNALSCGLILGLLGLASTGLLSAEDREPPSNKVTDQEIGLLKERLQDLVREEQKFNETNAPSEARERVHNQIREIKVALARRSHPDFEPKQQLESAARRIEHLRMAAKNLKQAEAHDLAHAVMEKAEAQERELAEAKKHLAGQQAQAHQSRDAVEAQELRREVEQLRSEIRELRQLIEKRRSEPTDR